MNGDLTPYDSAEHYSTEEIKKFIPIGLSMLASYVPILGVSMALANGVVALKQKEALIAIEETLGQVQDELRQRITQENAERVVIESVKAITNEADIRKLELFRKAFQEFAYNGQIEDVDDYVDNLAILRDISLRELKMLLIIREKAPGDLSMGVIDYHDASGIPRPSVGKRLAKEFDADYDQVRSAEIRLSRTGLYMPNNEPHLVGELVGLERFLKSMSIIE